VAEGGVVETWTPLIFISLQEVQDNSSSTCTMEVKRQEEEEAWSMTKTAIL
jgi:hypothetical protein